MRDFEDVEISFVVDVSRSRPANHLKLGTCGDTFVVCKPPAVSTNRPHLPAFSPASTTSAAPSAATAMRNRQFVCASSFYMNTRSLKGLSDQGSTSANV